ncbi:hypothetical protein IOLA_299 [uncultured bacterium]|nr:hypothetical protein IOLA_299 [uncultured bacterium]
MSNNLSINTQKISNNYKEARAELKSVIKSLINNGLMWSNNLDKEDLFITAIVTYTFVPLLSSTFELICQKNRISVNQFNIKLLKFSLSTFLISNVIFNKSVFVALSNIFKSTKSMLLIIPENYFIETEERIINKFNNSIENGINLNKDNIFNLVANELINDIVENEDL